MLTLKLQKNISILNITPADIKFKTKHFLLLLIKKVIKEFLF